MNTPDQLSINGYDKVKGIVCSMIICGCFFCVEIIAVQYGSTAPTLPIVRDPLAFQHCYNNNIIKQLILRSKLGFIKFISTRVDSVYYKMINIWQRFKLADLAGN